MDVVLRAPRVNHSEHFGFGESGPNQSGDDLINDCGLGFVLECAAIPRCPKRLIVAESAELAALDVDGFGDGGRINSSIHRVVLSAIQSRRIWVAIRFCPSGLDQVIATSQERNPIVKTDPMSRAVPVRAQLAISNPGPDGSARQLMLDGKFLDRVPLSIHVR